MLRVTPKVCYSRPATEAAETDGYVEVEEITLDNEVKRIFSGWMFAASPGLNAVEHPVYDVWLIGCRMNSDIPPPEANRTEVRVPSPTRPAAGPAMSTTERPSCSPSSTAFRFPRRKSPPCPA